MLPCHFITLTGSRRGSHRVHQTPGIVVSWLIDHLFGTSMFLNFTGIKYNNVISNLCHHRKVMGDIDGG